MNNHIHIKAYSNRVGAETENILLLGDCVVLSPLQTRDGERNSRFWLTDLPVCIGLDLGLVRKFWELRSSPVCEGLIGDSVCV